MENKRLAHRWVCHSFKQNRKGAGGGRTVRRFRDYPPFRLRTGSFHCLTRQNLDLKRWDAVEIGNGVPWAGLVKRLYIICRS